MTSKTQSEIEPKAAAINFMADMSAKAERISLISFELDALQDKKNVLFEEKEKLRGELLTDMKSINQPSLKTLSGESYYISKVKTYNITNETAMDLWARRHLLVRPDKVMVTDRLKEMARQNEPLPDFAEAVEKEVLNVRKPKDKAGE